MTVLECSSRSDCPSASLLIPRGLYSSNEQERDQKYLALNGSRDRLLPVQVMDDFKLGAIGTAPTPSKDGVHQELDRVRTGQLKSNW